MCDGTVRLCVVSAGQVRRDPKSKRVRKSPSVSNQGTLRDCSGVLECSSCYSSVLCRGEPRPEQVSVPLVVQGGGVVNEPLHVTNPPPRQGEIHKGLTSLSG